MLVVVRGHALRTSQDTTCGGVRCRAVVDACSCAFLLFPAHQNVEPNHNPTVDAFSNPANAQKNRYGNITCCECGFSDSAHACIGICGHPAPSCPTPSDDHSRVRLTPTEGVAGSDYINGNFLDVRRPLIALF